MILPHPDADDPGDELARKRVKKVMAPMEKKAGKRSREDKGTEECPSKRRKDGDDVTDEENTPDTPAADISNQPTEKSTEESKKWNLKISSWNVNGLKAWLKKGSNSYISEDSPDIFCVQETKCSENQIPKDVCPPGYHTYWNYAEKKGYSGVGLCTKKKPLNVKYDMGVAQHDHEGRVITAEYDDFYLVTAYIPNSGRGLLRLDYRQEWDKDFCKYLKSLDEKKPVILCGDLNVAHKEIDLANPKTNKRTAGFTQEERDSFTDLLKEGFVDTFRHLYPDKKQVYSFWTYMRNARAGNVGWRLDYFVVSERLLPTICDSTVRSGIHGSDHCPVELFLSL